MALQRLTLDSLSKLAGGLPAIQFQKELEAVMKDCQNSPGDLSTRKVHLTFNVSPVVGQDGVCDGVEVEFECYHAVPKRRTRPFSMILHASGHALFNAESPDNPRQHTLDDLARPKPATPRPEVDNSHNGEGRDSGTVTP